jgi:hypothetical protein
LTCQTLCSKHYSRILFKPICKSAVNIAVKYSQAIAQVDTGTAHLLEDGNPVKMPEQKVMDPVNFVSSSAKQIHVAKTEVNIFYSRW